jgi:hypothetical protein
MIDDEASKLIPQQDLATTDCGMFLPVLQRTCTCTGHLASFCDLVFLPKHSIN